MSDVRKYLELLKGAKPIEVLPINKAADFRASINSLQSKASKPSKLYLIVLYEI